MAFMLLTTLLPLVIASGPMAGPTMLLTGMISAMVALSDVFWQLRVCQIKGDSYKINWHIDPSGYVYEGVTSNRIEGVKTTVSYIPYDENDEGFWDAPKTENAQLWDASEWDQQNPLYTDANGCYAWDVPEGWWQVAFEKEGYETATSQWLPVPPPQTEVHMGLVSLAGPCVEAVEETQSGILVTFSQYMDPDTVSGIVLKDADGNSVSYTLDYSKEETDLSGTVYAKEFTLCIADGETVTSIEVPESVCNYAGKAIEPYTGYLGMIVDETIKFNHTLNLASDISINFAVASKFLAGYDSFYLECVQPVYEGNVQTGTQITRVQPVPNGSYYYFTLTGLTAVNMGDVAEATLYMSKDGQSYCSAIDRYSVAQYAYAQLNKVNATQKLKSLCADLLRYGAAAQNYKAYRVDSLVDREMTETHRSYLRDLDAVSFGNNNVTLKDLDSPAVVWVGKALNLDSKVELKFVFDTSAYKGAVENLTLRVTYANYEGKTKELVLENPETYNAARNYYAFTFNGLLAAELRAVVSVAVYEGNERLSQTLQYSADTYGNNKTGALLELCKALIAYSDTALAFFTN